MRILPTRLLLACLIAISLPAGALAAEAPRPRAREVGIVIGSLPPGPRNAITDVEGVGVGVGDGVGVLNSSAKMPGLDASADCGSCELPNALMPTMIIAMMTSAIERIKNALG